MEDYEFDYWDEFDQSLPECDYPDSDWYEDADHIEIGFDPYMGCYTDDC